MRVFSKPLESMHAAAKQMPEPPVYTVLRATHTPQTKLPHETTKHKLSHVCFITNDTGYFIQDQQRSHATRRHTLASKTWSSMIKLRSIMVTHKSNITPGGPGQRTLHPQ